MFAKTIVKHIIENAEKSRICQGIWSLFQSMLTWSDFLKSRKNHLDISINQHTNKGKSPIDGFLKES